MLNLEKRLNVLRRQFKELGDDAENPKTPLGIETMGRISECLDLMAMMSHELPDSAIPSKEFKRTLVVTVTESIEEYSYNWECEVRLPSGKVLSGSLSDDMPSTPGEAVASAGRLLDASLATDRWEELWSEESKRTS